MQPGRRRYDPLNPPRWCVWRWRPINGDYRTGSDIETRHYLLRLYLLLTQSFSVCIHWVNFADPDPDPHDHQRGFFSIVLRGWYREEVYPPSMAVERCVRVFPVRRTVHWWNWKPHGSVHRIVEVAPGTVTFVLHGKRRSDWHFYPKHRMLNARVPVPWLDYTAGTVRQS